MYQQFQIFKNIYTKNVNKNLIQLTRNSLRNNEYMMKYFQTIAVQNVDRNEFKM